MLVGLLSQFLMVLRLPVSTVQRTDTLLTALLELVNEGISLVGTLDEDDALVDLAGLQDLMGGGNVGTCFK
jgi:hypothetical protein